MRNKRILLMTTIIMIVVISAITRKKEENSLLVINEICSRNASIIKPNRNGADDYIELYNTSDEELALEGWFLSDDSNNLELQSLSGIVVPAHGFKVLYADDSEEGNNALCFKISQSGESIFLTNQEGKIVNQVYIPKDKQLLCLTLEYINELIEKCDFYLIRCNTDISAAETSYRGLGL